MPQGQTFTNIQPIQAPPQQTFTDVTPISQTSAEKSGPLDREIPLTSYGNATLSGLQSIGRGLRGAVSGAWNTIAHPIDTAKSIAELPSQAAQVPGAIRDINASQDPTGTYAKVGQETAGQGAGQALTALATEGIVKGAPALASTRVGRVAGKFAKGTLEDIPGVRQVGKISKYWRETAPPEGKPLLYDEPAGPPTPDPALLKSESLARAFTPKTAPAASTGEALAQMPKSGAIAEAMQPPAADTSLAAGKAIVRKSLQQMLQDSMGGRELSPTTPLREQLDVAAPKAATADTSLPEGHTAFDSSAVRSGKYDAGAREYHARGTGGEVVYVYGDVSPDAAQAFQQAESKGKAWQTLKQNHPLVAKIVNGKRIAVKPTP